MEATARTGTANNTIAQLREQPKEQSETPQQHMQQQQQDAHTKA
eukprot:CAMPEP_0168228040 /NCGR_PEP_ID=MMETSP0140_2-20121125/14419_1 /TAXON_ID=44445 /ORGANISM="Pseudo-nitzschia australis, Strain 10249 10 AB" /LENGTH=43 /DNA_ID= /DNA_START= /DNA_END= /DNA_ORIENTATION=